MSFASLPMYNPAEAPGASAALWSGIARHFRRAGIENVPDVLLDRPPIPDHWFSDELLFSQTCGYPLQTIHRGQGRLSEGIRVFARRAVGRRAQIF